MIVAIDVGEKDYFVKNKQPIGERMALAAGPSPTAKRSNTPAPCSSK